MEDLLNMIKDYETNENFNPTNKIKIDFDSLIVPDKEEKINYELSKYVSDSCPDLNFIINKELSPMIDYVFIEKSCQEGIVNELKNNVKILGKPITRRNVRNNI